MKASSPVSPPQEKFLYGSWESASGSIPKSLLRTYSTYFLFIFPSGVLASGSLPYFLIYSYSSHSSSFNSFINLIASSIFLFSTSSNASSHISSKKNFFGFRVHGNPCRHSRVQNNFPLTDHRLTHVQRLLLENEGPYGMICSSFTCSAWCVFHLFSFLFVRLQTPGFQFRPTDIQT